MKFYLVYIAEDSGDSACAEWLGESRVFDNLYSAQCEYEINRKSNYDCMQLVECEFIHGKLTPLCVLQQCGNLVGHLGIK